MVNVGVSVPCRGSISFYLEVALKKNKKLQFPSPAGVL